MDEKQRYFEQELHIVIQMFYFEILHLVYQKQ